MEDEEESKRTWKKQNRTDRQHKHICSLFGVSFFVSVCVRGSECVLLSVCWYVERRMIDWSERTSERTMCARRKSTKCTEKNKHLGALDERNGNINNKTNGLNLYVCTYRTLTERARGWSFFFVFCFYLLHRKEVVCKVQCESLPFATLTLASKKYMFSENGEKNRSKHRWHIRCNRITKENSEWCKTLCDCVRCTLHVKWHNE